MDTTNRAILASGKSRNYRMVIRANSAAGHEVDGYEHLELRPDSWRRQPNLKGRNLTVGQLVWKMTVNGVTPEAAVEEYDLPLSQIEEALAYYRQHRDVVAQDEEDERRRLETVGIIGGAAAADRRVR